MNRVMVAFLLSGLWVGTWAGSISLRPNPFARQGRIVGGNATESSIIRIRHRCS